MSLRPQEVSSALIALPLTARVVAVCGMLCSASPEPCAKPILSFCGRVSIATVFSGLHPSEESQRRFPHPSWTSSQEERQERFRIFGTASLRLSHNSNRIGTCSTFQGTNRLETRESHVQPSGLCHEMPWHRDELQSGRHCTCQTSSARSRH